jgi:monofunctional glycosyltransferase
MGSANRHIRRVSWMRALSRWLLLMLLAVVGLQLFFVVRIVAMNWWLPESTSFQRSQAWRIVMRDGQLPWRQASVEMDAMAKPLQRAVIASEDANFTQHQGVWWQSIESAWQKNAKAKAQAEKRAQRQPDKPVTVKIVGGSTITQQLAKNLFLSGERTLLRKGQEMVLALTLETFLSKRRILEIYLNSVEWGEGVFGAEAAAQHYFRKSAARLNAWEAARLAVMLPRPRYFEKLAQSAYLARRAETIMARMNDVVLP